MLLDSNGLVIFSNQILINFGSATGDNNTQNTFAISFSNTKYAVGVCISNTTSASTLRMITREKTYITFSKVGSIAAYGSFIAIGY